MDERQLKFTLFSALLKEASALKAKGRLIVGYTVLFQISVEGPAMRH